MDKYVCQAASEAENIVRAHKGAFNKVRALAAQGVYVEGYKSLRTITRVGRKYIAIVDVAYEGGRRVVLGANLEEVINWFVAQRATDLFSDEVALSS